MSREGRTEEAVSSAGFHLYGATLSLSVTPFIYVFGKVLRLK